MSVTGDFAKLKKLQKTLDTVKAKCLPSVTAAAKEAAFAAYQDDFSGSHDPMGTAWAPTQDGGTPLIATSALANPAVIVRKGQSVLVRPVRYGRFHQFSKRMPQRRILPFEEGSQWDPKLEAAINEAIEAYFGYGALGNSTVLGSSKK